MQKIFRFTNQDKILFNQFLNSPIESISREKTENKKMIEAIRLIVNKYPKMQLENEILLRKYNQLEEKHEELLKALRERRKVNRKIRTLTSDNTDIKTPLPNY